MPAVTPLEGVIRFFETIGIYRVVLPFLLTFTIVFALLERSKVLGSEKIGGETYPKKNLNALVAFVIAFFVVASAQLVETITTIGSHFVILLMLIIFFLMLVGSFYTHEEWEKGDLGKWVKWGFIAIIFVGIVGIFLNAIKNKVGETWLEVLIDWIEQFWTSAAVASIILLIFLILFIYWITRPQDGGAD